MDRLLGFFFNEKEARFFGLENVKEYMRTEQTVPLVGRLQ